MTTNYCAEPSSSLSALSPTAVATFLDLSERALLNLRRDDPTFPAPKMVGCLPRWTAARIIAWLNDVPTSCPTTDIHEVEGPATSPAKPTGQIATRSTKPGAAATNAKVRRRVQ